MNAAAGSRAAAAERFRYGVLAGVAVLIALVTGWCLESGASGGRIALAILLTSPLWLALRGLGRGSRRTCAWMTLAVIPYIVLGIMEVVANPHARWWAAACLLVCFLLFVTLVAYLRVTRERVPRG